MMTNFYVYYRIAAGTHSELARVVEEIFAVVARETGIRGRWMCRRDDRSTCMEVYEQVADAPRFEALLARETQHTGFDRFLATGSTRQTECFVDAEG